MEIFLAQQLRQGEGNVLRWLALAAATGGEWATAKEKIERSIAIFEEVGAHNYVPHLRVIDFLIDKGSLQPSHARSWLTEILCNALEIREFDDVFWTLSALAYVLLMEQSSVVDVPLPPAVQLAAEIRGFVGMSLEYGRSAYMQALVH